MFFSNSYNKPGPGVPKDAPAKTGFVLFWDVLTRDFWGLIGINMLYCLLCVPIVTIGAATIAFCKLSCNMVMGTHVFLLSDFWQAFRNNLKKSLLYSFLLVLIAADLFIMGMTILTAGLVGIPMIVTSAVCLFVAFLIVAVSIYIFPLLATTDLKLVDLVKNAVFLAVLGKWNTFFATACLMAIYIAIVYFFPLSGIILFTVGFIFIFTILCFFTWPIIAKYIIKSDTENGTFDHN
ncbi:MAG: YesL family protein [Oscillospiraceae bacterium]